MGLRPIFLTNIREKPKENEVNESWPGHWASPSEPYEIGKMQQSDSKIEKYALHNDGPT